MKESKNFNYHEHDEVPEIYPDVSNVASATETTGVMPTPPRNRSEMNSYQDVANMAIPKMAPPKGNKKEKLRTEKQKQDRPVL